MSVFDRYAHIRLPQRGDRRQKRRATVSSGHHGGECVKRLRLLTAALASTIAFPAWAQEHAPVEVSAATHGDTVRSPFDLARSADGFAPSSSYPALMPLPSQAVSSGGALQDAAGYNFAAPIFGSGVDGLGFGFQGAATVDGSPPNPVGAVGATQYVQMATLRFVVFDKATKTPVIGSMSGNVLWTGFGGPCETENAGDAIVLYDKAADRWVISQFTLNSAPTIPYYECVAVSKTSDATGAY